MLFYMMLENTEQNLSLPAVSVIVTVTVLSSITLVVVYKYPFQLLLGLSFLQMLPQTNLRVIDVLPTALFPANTNLHFSWGFR